MMIKTYAAVAMASLVLAGCAQDSGPKETSGALLGGLLGATLTVTKAKPLPQAATDKMQETASDGYLVAVKMPPHLGEQAEAIARRLGAKQILL